MAQFSSLAGINDVNSTLQQISAKLDALAPGQAGRVTNRSISHVFLHLA